MNWRFYRNGLPNGIGVIYYKSGEILEGRFLNGELVNKVIDEKKFDESSRDIEEQTTTPADISTNTESNSKKQKNHIP